MNKREGEGHYPEAMLDMGMPQEMGTLEQGTEAGAAPFVEITKEDFPLGEGLEEISRPEDLTVDR